MSWTIAQRAIVVDASIAVPLLLGHPDWMRAWRSWTEADVMLLVPSHFGHEVANALLRSARIGAAATMSALEDLARLRYDIADRGFSGLQASVRLADEHGLSVCDAAYLELAIDVDGELATLDAALRAAAVKESVPLIGPV
jgi:predicted nucleic acid-binding protein